MKRTDEWNDNDEALRLNELLYEVQIRAQARRIDDQIRWQRELLVLQAILQLTDLCLQPKGSHVAH